LLACDTNARNAGGHGGVHLRGQLGGTGTGDGVDAQPHLVAGRAERAGEEMAEGLLDARAADARGE